MGLVKRVCTNCGENFTRWDEFVAIGGEEVLEGHHTKPEECIRHLANRLDAVERILSAAMRRKKDG